MVRIQKLLDPMATGRDAEHLEANLRSKVVGQDDTIHQIVSVYQAHLAGLSAPGRPIGNFLFLGPTGTGKTRLVEAVAETLAGDSRAMIKIDCAEFQHSHEIAKLIGSPPGYLGHRETRPALSQEALNQHHTDTMKVSFVLFDEIEKASDALWNLLLGILDKATLTLGDNRQVDFSSAMIFMTSNLGAREMMSMLMPGAGFIGQAPRLEEIDSQIERAAVAAARRKFTPEFLNRIDKIMVFHPLSENELRRILEMELLVLQRRFLDGANATPFTFSVSDSAKTFLLSQGTDIRYGARHLKRELNRSLVYPMSNLLASAQLAAGDCIRIDFDSDHSTLLFYKEAEEADPVPAEVVAITTAAGRKQKTAAK